MATRKRTVLIVYAHQEPKSFNCALKDEAVKTLTELGNKVVVSDLYAMNFDPCARREHFKGELLNPDKFNFQEELSHAPINGLLPEDVKAELDKLSSADLVILQFPIYWLSFPAILKGWMERCLADNVAYQTKTGKWFNNGNYKNKKLILSFTTSGKDCIYSNKGLFGDMNTVLWPMQYGLRITGFQILAPNICYAPAFVSQEVREGYLKSWTDRLRTVFDEKPLPFVAVENFDAASGFVLKEEYLKSEQANKYAPTVGQNLGKPLSPDSSMKPSQ